MTIDPDTFLTTVYATVDDFCAQHPGPLRPGPKPVMGDSEVLTVMLLKAWYGTSERGALAWVQARFPAAFPHLLTPSAFNRRARALAFEMAQLLHELSGHLTIGDDVYEILDGLPIPVATTERGQRRRCLLPEAADIGRGGTGKGWYYGVSLLGCVSAAGVITGFVTAPANDAERWQASALISWRHDPTAVPMDVEAITPPRGHGRTLTGPVGHQLSPTTAGETVAGVYLADRGFAGTEWQQVWRRRYGATVIAPETLEPEDRHWFHHARQRIETVFAVLTDVLHIKHPRVRTEAGLITRIVSACTAFNLGIFINRRFDRPDLAHGTLFRA